MRSRRRICSSAKSTGSINPNRNMRWMTSSCESVPIVVVISNESAAPIKSVRRGCSYKMRDLSRTHCGLAYQHSRTVGGGQEYGLKVVPPHPGGIVTGGHHCVCGGHANVVGWGTGQFQAVGQ